MPMGEVASRARLTIAVRPQRAPVSKKLIHNLWNGGYHLKNECGAAGDEEFSAGNFRVGGSVGGEKVGSSRVP